MLNCLGEGDTLVLTAPAAVASGAGALIGNTFGVAKTAIASGAKGPFLIEGKVSLPKDANAIGEGVKVYWDNTAKVVTATATSNTLIGVSILARLAGDTTAQVRLNGAFV